MGFTKIVTATVLARRRASRIRARWPSWSAPIVGTSPSRAPVARKASAAAPRSPTVRTIRGGSVTAPSAPELLQGSALDAHRDHLHGRFDLGERRQGRRDADVPIARILSVGEGRSG